MNNEEQLKILLKIEQTKGKISSLTKYLQKISFDLKRLQVKKDELELLIK